MYAHTLKHKRRRGCKDTHGYAAGDAGDAGIRRDTQQETQGRRQHASIPANELYIGIGNRHKLQAKRGTKKAKREEEDEQQT